MKPAGAEAGVCLDEDLVVDLIERRLPAGRRAEVEAHLDQCIACRKLVAEAACTAHQAPTAPAADPRAGASADGRAEWAEPEPGQSCGRYLIERRIGAGGMGAVYAAWDPALGRHVALKILHPSDSSHSEELRSRLTREARVLSAIRHPHVVPIHDVLETEQGLPVLVMDLLVGESLRRCLEREGRLAVPRVARLMVQVLSALEAAHGLGVVHRDLKPDNIFLVQGEDGRESARILDFGIAKLTRLDERLAEARSLTRTGMIVGTPHYMSPEQAFGDQEVDARTDLWAVGVLLYECISGALPTHAEKLGQVLRTLATLSIRPLPEVAPDVPRELAELVRRLLAPRDQRPSSAAEVAAVLERYVDVDAPLLEPGPERRRLGLRLAAALGLLLAGLGVAYGLGAGRWLAAGTGPPVHAAEAGPMHRQPDGGPERSQPDAAQDRPAATDSPGVAVRGGGLALDRGPPGAGVIHRSPRRAAGKRPSVRVDAAVLPLARPGTKLIARPPF